MQRRSLLAVLAVPVAAVFGLALVRTAHSEGEAPKPVAKIRDVMLGVNAPTSTVGLIRDAFNQATLDDEGFELAAARATMVIEAGTLIWGMKPPLGADDAAGVAKWREHVMAYRGCAEAVRDAAVKKDLAAGKTAVQSLSKKCNECHKDHRKEE